MAQESQPGGTTGILARPVVMGENPANYVFVDLDVERQGHLLSDSRTALPSWNYAASFRRPHE